LCYHFFSCLVMVIILKIRFTASQKVVCRKEECGIMEDCPHFIITVILLEGAGGRGGGGRDSSGCCGLVFTPTGGCSEVVGSLYKVVG
jgi:hypothetical protein